MSVTRTRFLMTFDVCCALQRHAPPCKSTHLLPHSLAAPDCAHPTTPNRPLPLRSPRVQRSSDCQRWQRLAGRHRGRASDADAGGWVACAPALDDNQTIEIVACLGSCCALLALCPILAIAQLHACTAPPHGVQQCPSSALARSPCAQIVQEDIYMQRLTDAAKDVQEGGPHEHACAGIALDHMLAQHCRVQAGQCRSAAAPW